MLPTADEIIETFTFVSIRHQWKQQPNSNSIKKALQKARGLNAKLHDEPAALFFEFSRHPHAFPDGWRVMTTLIALNAASTRRMRLRASPEDLRALRLAIKQERLEFADVRQWFTERLEHVVGTRPPLRCV